MLGDFMLKKEYQLFRLNIFIVSAKTEFCGYYVFSPLPPPPPHRCPGNFSVTTWRKFMKLGIMIGSHVNCCALILGWPLTFPLCTASICASVFTHKPIYLGTRLTNRAELLHECSSWIALYLTKNWWRHLQPFLHSVHLFVCLGWKSHISHEW